MAGLDWVDVDGLDWIDVCRPDWTDACCVKSINPGSPKIRKQ